MRKITIPTKVERTQPPRDVPPNDAPRPRLGLKYGANMDSRARP